MTGREVRRVCAGIISTTARWSLVVREGKLLLDTLLDKAAHPSSVLVGWSVGWIEGKVVS